MACENLTLDSNLVGLRYAEEECFGVLKQNTADLPNVVWHPCDPNSYGDFGASYTRTARNTINASRQKRKGSISGQSANASYQQDFVQHSLTDLIQGFMYADWRKKAVQSSTEATTTGILVADDSGFSADDLVLVSGFSNSANNGLKKAAVVSGGEITVSGTVAETGATAAVYKVGVEAATDDIAVVLAGSVASLTSVVFDFTTLGLIPGEWIFVGGDAALSKFDDAACNGMYRVKSVTANEIVFDRTPSTPTADLGTGKNIRIFIADLIRNEPDPSLIKRRTYTFERAFKSDLYEYINGATPNTFNVSIPEEGLITTDMSFVALSSDDVAVRKAGDFSETLPEEEAFTSGTSLMNLRMQEEDSLQTLFTVVSSFSLDISNNVNPVKAAGHIGAVKTTIGDFMVSGQMTTFFTSEYAVNAIKENVSVSFDFQLIENNQGWLFDIPYLSLGGGSKNVTKDSPVTLDIQSEGAQHPTLGYTLLMQKFHYLPALAG